MTQDWKKKLTATIKLEPLDIDFSEMEKRAVIDMAKHKDDSVDALAMAFGVPQAFLTVSNASLEEFRAYCERVKLPAELLHTNSYFVTDGGAFAEIRYQRLPWFNDRHKLLCMDPGRFPSFVSQAMLLIAFIILMLILGA